jgi:hypothetical protein
MLPRELTHNDLYKVVEHVASVTGCSEFVIGGRGALVASCDGHDLLATVDFDIGITLEGEIRGLETFESELGASSAFAAENGFYIEHAGAEMLTYVLPEGWRDRALRLQRGGVTALCLAPVDVAINKLHAKRAKDLDHLAMMLRAGLVTVTQLRAAVSASPYAFMRDDQHQVLDAVLKRLSPSDIP